MARKYRIRLFIFINLYLFLFHLYLLINYELYCRFRPGRFVTNIISETIQANFNKPWKSFGELNEDEEKMFFDLFKVT